MPKEEQEMDRPGQTTRRTHRQTVAHSFSPRAEEKSCSGSIGDQSTLHLGKSSRTTLFPLAVKNDQNHLRLEAKNYTQSITTITNNLASNEKFNSKLKSLKASSSGEISSMDNGHQKRPIKLAPLDLPEDVKIAQLKKINELKDEIYLVRKNKSQGEKILKALVIRDPLENADFARDTRKPLNLLSRDKLDLQASSSEVITTPGNIRGRLSSSSVAEVKSRHIRSSASNTVTMNFDDKQNVSSKEHLNYGKSDGKSPNTPRLLKINKPVIAHNDQMTDAGRGETKQREAKLVTPALKI